MNLCLFLHFFLSAFPILILTDEFTPFYQSTVTNLSEWNFTNVNSTINNNTCKVGNSFFEIIGGALNFNYNTILTKLCQTKQKTAAFYRMKLFMMVYLPNSNFNRNYSGYNIQISLNETKFLHFYLNETSNENKQCTNLVYSNQYSLIPLYIDISLSNYNLSSFSMGINLNFSSKYDNNYYYPWGFSNLTVELYECDSSLCSSCNILPRNCSVFCSIQCKSCSYLNPKKCTSCYSPNILNPNGECESTNEILADYYFNDDYTEGNVSALISSNTLNYYSDKKTAGYLSECGPYLKLFGGYEKFWNSTIIYIILPFVENHFQIRILFRFIKISNWREGENFKLTIGDVDRTYPFEMDSDNLTGVLCGNKNNLGNSQILTLNFTINHTTTNLTMIFQILNQTLNDGSWGIKDLYVTYYDCFVGCDTCFGGTYADCDNCKPGFVMVEGYCLECDANCKRCKNNKTKTCDLCWPSSKDIYLLNETCVEVCPAPFYPDSNSVCNKCPELCADCVNASFCKVCSSNQSLYKEDLYTQKCLTRTGCAEIQGYYVDNSQNYACLPCNSSCKTCEVTSINCKNCSLGYISTSLPGNCLNYCPNSYYNDTNLSTCQPCNSSCDKCYGGSSQNCTECSSSYFLQNNSCSLNCLGDTSSDTYTKTCMICTSPCNNCSKTPTECTSCQNNLYLYNNSCITECPPQFYSDSIQECKPCNSSCDNCTGPNSIDCTSCSMPYFYYYKSNECLTICPNGTKGIDSICHNCSATCNTCDGITNNDCISCFPNFYKQPNNGSCLSECDPGYYNNKTSFKCENCSLDCATCEGPLNNQCLSCKPLNYLNLSKMCLKSCPETFFQNDKNLTCDSCFSGCKSCANNSQNACNSCLDSHYYFFENSCYTNCPTGLYPNSSTRKCELCYSGCAECFSGLSNNCSSCKNGSFIFSNSCLTNCPEGYYPNKSSLHCDKCNLECGNCFGFAANNCLSCQTGLFLLKDSCHKICPNGTFANETNKLCENCSSVCLLCNGEDNNCSSCVNSYELNGTSCISNCSDGKYLEKNGSCLPCNTKCLTCMSELECLTCNNGTYLLEKDCVQVCGESYWGSTSSNKCISCDKSCKTCENSSKDSCSDCAQTYYFLNSTCFLQCPSHYFKNLSSPNCSNCDIACDECYDSSENSCSNCSSNYYFLSMSCVNNCGNGYFPNLNSKKCEKCSLECSNCYGALNGNCTECTSDYFLLKNICYKNCPQGFYNNVSNNLCKSCDANCKNCFGGSSTNCSSCFRDKFLISSQCEEICPNGYYPNSGDSTCGNCHDFCNTCGGPFNDGSCTKCNGDRVLNDGICINNGTCPSNKWQNGSLCQLCNDKCKTCVGASDQNCTSCKNNTYLLDTECLAECPKSLFAFTDVWKCLKLCDFTCKDCIGPGAAECNSCSVSRYLNGTTSAECPCNSGFFSQEKSTNNDTCLACDSSCNECDGPTSSNCTECPSNKDLILGRCECHVGLFSVGRLCERCDPFCYTCFGTSSNNCTTCSKNKHISPNNSCVCDSGFFLKDRVCLACHYSCQECIGSERSDCISDKCAGNHVYSNGMCSCPYWAYDLEKNKNCSNKTSLVCHATCNESQCFGPNFDDCYSCIEGRTMKSNACFCNDGTYEDSLGSCKKCYPTCKKCNGPLFSNCLEECVSNSRGIAGIPIEGICNCSPDLIETLENDCPSTPILLSSFKSVFAATIFVDTPSMALIAFSQSTIVVTKFIESCQLFSYLSYLNLQYPLNTKTYFKMLNYFNVDPIFDSSYTIDNSENNSSNSSESNLSLNSSILLSNYTNNNRRILDDQNKFEIIKYRESEFLKNSIVILAINGVVFGFSVVYSIMYFFFNLQKHNILTTLYSILHWSLPIRIFNLTSLQLFFYIALEFSKKSDMNNFDGVISIMITVLLVLLHLYFLKIINRDYNNAETYKYYGALFDGLSTFFFIKRNYFFINIVRKALVVTFIVSTTLDSQSQILGCMIVCLMFLSYIVFFKPFLSNLEWIFNIIMELCFCSLLSVIFTYSYIDYDNAPEKIRFGYAIIVSLSVFMLSTFIFAIIQIWKFLKNLYIVFKNREKNIGLLEKKSSSDSLNDSSNSAFKSKIGDAFYEYKREYDNQKKVIVVYSQEMEEKKKRREEERVEREEMKIRIKDIEDEKKSRTGLQSIFTRQKNKVNKKKNSFDEEEEDEEKNPEVQTNLDVVREQEVIKNRKIEDENLKGFEKFFKKQKKTKEKNSVDEREQDEQNDEKKEINIEMKNY